MVIGMRNPDHGSERRSSPLKIFCLVLLAAICAGCRGFMYTSGRAEGLPEIPGDLDFGGADVYFYDWWSADARAEEPTDEQQLQYDYWDELEAACNVKVHQVALSDWEGNPAVLAEMVMNGDDSRLCVVGISTGFAGAALANNLFMPWTYGLDRGVFNDAAVDFMTRNGVCYGVTWGSAVEPRQGVFFNKRILEDANIDWNELYDLQAAGKWTWDKMEEYMDKVQRNAGVEGNPEVYALTGNADDVTIALVVSNGADFYDFNEQGELVPAIDTENMREALSRRIAWDNQYMRPAVQWNDYQKFWADGTVAFMIGQSYEGFNGNGTDNQVADEWGFVAVPMGPKADHYTSAAEDNVFGIPNVYDEETSLKLQQLFTLWISPVPGSDEDSWASPFYPLTDERAIEETYAMLRRNENATIMKFNLIGDRNSAITEITRNLYGGSVDQIISDALEAFRQRCDKFN